MRKSFPLQAACAVSAMIVSGCAVSGNTDAAEPSFDGMPDPFTEASDLKGAAELAGFPVSFDGKCDGHSIIRVIKGSLAEIICEKDGNELYRVRKGSGPDDVSGDYSEYKLKEEKKDSAGRTVTLKGNDGISWSLAAWHEGDYSYSVSPASPMGTSEILTLAGRLR